MGFLTHPEHWLFATVITMSVGIPIVYLASRLGVQAGIKDFRDRIDKTHAEMHELHGGLTREIDEVRKYARAVKGDSDRKVSELDIKVSRLTDRVSAIESAGEE